MPIPRAPSITLDDLTRPPDDRVNVVSIATSQPADHDCHATRWTLDDIARTILNENYAQAMSRSTIWRILEETDLKPHKSEYWLNSHDPIFDEKARDICQLYVAAPQFYQQGRLVICCDEKTGMQILERKHPTKPMISGIPERREHEYIRHGARALINSFAVPTGQIAWNLGLTRTSKDFTAHLRHAVSQFPEMERYDWVLDNLNTHWSLDVCQLVAEWCKVPFDPGKLARGADRRAFLTDPTHKHVFHFTPKHGSWLNQVELFFGVLQRRFLARGEFKSAEEFEQRLTVAGQPDPVFRHDTPEHRADFRDSKSIVDRVDASEWPGQLRVPVPSLTWLACGAIQVRRATTSSWTYRSNTAWTMSNGEVVSRSFPIRRSNTISESFFGHHFSKVIA